MSTPTSLIRDYQSYTIQSSNNHGRLSFLPCFPPLNQAQTKNNHDEEKTLLLANVPATMLSTSERALRQINTFPRQFQYIENENIHIPSFFTFIYRNFIGDLSKKLKISESILDFNLIRLAEITKQVARNHNTSHYTDPAHPTLNMAYHLHEWARALEIFLQIDVDSFCMKTCTFRGSRPRSVRKITTNVEEEESLFCLDQLGARYLMLPCNNQCCTCCYQSLDISRRHESSVQFANEDGHRFVNGYRIYLNCHASCNTTNFIYVLTCPCGQFDFIGSSLPSNKTFKDVFLHYRQQSTRVLHEFLLGEKIIRRTLHMFEREKTIDEKTADHMFLYRHLTECSVAIQLLLNRTAIYWPFIPIEMAEADREDNIFFHHTTLNNTETENQQQPSYEENQADFTSNSDETSSPYERTNQEVEWCLANLPKTPDDTRFSRLQINKQKVFFKHGWDRLCLPPRHLDIFNMTIVFVLPDDCSQLLCHVIESLLITHAECKLNTTGHLVENHHHHHRSSNTTSWYKNLLGRIYKY